MGLFLLGIVCGLAIVVIALVLAMPRMGRMFFTADKSLVSFDEAVQRLREQCAQHKPWHITQEKNYDAAYADRGKEKLPFKLVEFKLGNPNHSYLVNKQFPAVSTLMPAAIAVVEYENGDVIIYRKNTGLMANMFTGDIKRIMKDEVPKELDAILHGVIKAK